MSAAPYENSYIYRCFNQKSHISSQVQRYRGRWLPTVYVPVIMVVVLKPLPSGVDKPDIPLDAFFMTRIDPSRDARLDILPKVFPALEVVVKSVLSRAVSWGRCLDLPIILANC